MLCYKDRTYCNREDCKFFKKCEDSMHTAFKEKAVHPDAFCRETLPVSVADLSKLCTRKEF